MTLLELNKKLIALNMPETLIISEKTDEKLNRINKYFKVKINKLIKEINLTLNNLF